MRKSAVVFIIAILSLGISVGCADGKKAKRGRVATDSISKVKDAGSEKDTGGQNADIQDTASGTASDTNQGTEIPAGSTTPETGTAKFDLDKSKEIISSFDSLKEDGEKVDLGEIKGLTLDIEEVAILYNSPEKDINESGYTALTTYKIKKNEEGKLQFQLSSDPVSTGNVKDVALLVLPVLDHVEFNENGNTINNETDRKLGLAPEVKNQILQLAEGELNLSERNVLESLFSEIPLLPLEQSETSGKLVRLSGTGVTIVTEVNKSTESLTILVETEGEDGILYFLLKFRVGNVSSGLGK